MENSNNHSRNSNIPVTPLPPIVGNPSMPVPPVGPNPEDQFPAYPGPDASFPIIPIPPQGGFPVYPGPSLPILPPVANYCKVRFLHAAANYVPLQIAISNQRVISNIAYSNLSSYGMIPDGFRTVTIATVGTPRTVLLRKTIPFKAGETVTLAIINTLNDIDIIKIDDTVCTKKPFDSSCMRVVNLSFNSPPLDILLNDGRVVYSDVRFKEVTAYKRIRRGNYGFVVAQTPHRPMPLSVDIETVGSERIIIEEDAFEPLLSFYINVKPNVLYTVYLLGIVNGSPTLQTLLVENY